MGSHSHSKPGDNMVAAQVLLGLWATGLAVAAPQLDFGDSRSVRVVESRAATTGAQDINQNQVVSDVVSALQPSIEAAIAEALASLSSNSVSSSSSGSVFSSGSSGLAATGGATAAVQEVPARYNYEYKVADSDAQNYISKSENRDGDTTTGSYSYVDPNGDLVTVNYEAGPMGYSAVTEKQKGFVKIRQQSTGSSSGFSSGSSSASGFTGATSTTSSSSSSSVDQSDLIARIIASLQPQISSAVQSALAVSSSNTGLVRETNRVATGRSAPARDLAGTFGNGVSVNIDTPEYNINY